MPRSASALAASRFDVPHERRARAMLEERHETKTLAARKGSAVVKGASVARSESIESLRYRHHVRQIPSLTQGEEARLARAFRDHGDQRAAARLVASNLRHVVSIALGYRRYGIPVSDLIAEGNFGIAHAIHKFDPERGNRFMTYAAYWVRAFILKHVIDSWSIVGMGSGTLRSKVFFGLRRERGRITSLLGEGDPANVLLAQTFGVTVEQVLAMALRVDAHDVSLDAKVFEDGPRSAMDAMVSGTPSQEELLSHAEEAAFQRARLTKAVRTLDARERYIVETRMMADTDEELSLAEIGRRMGISRERARQLESRTKRKLRDLLPPLAA
jgi:RNA polymerase sigma-32 factor